MTKLLVLVPMALCAVLVAAPARAADDHADRVNAAAAHFKRALHLVDTAEYEPALQEFRRAYETLPRYQVLYNIGLVLKLLDRTQESRATLERYLKEGGEAIPADRRAEVQALLQGMPADGSVRRDGPNPMVERPPPAAAPDASPVHRAPPPSSAGAPILSADTGLEIERQPEGSTRESSRAGRVVALSAATVGVAALSVYVWNHTRWQRWSAEDTRLSMTAAPSEPLAANQLVQRQARNDQLIDSVHLVDRVALGLGVTAGLGGLLAWWLWSPSEQEPIPSLAVSADIGPSSASFSLFRRF